VGIDCTAGSGFPGTAIFFNVDGQGPDGQWYTLNLTWRMSSTGPYVAFSDYPSPSVGSNPALQMSFPVMPTIRLRWQLNGMASATFGYWLMGQY